MSFSSAAKPTCPTFVALDFETADYGQDSACSLALVRCEQGAIVRSRVQLIRPPRPQIVFTYLHGITWQMVQSQPTFAQAWPQMAELLEGASFIAAHNAPFDRGILRTCCAGAGLSMPEVPFRCTVQVARQTWRIRPTKLPDVCTYLGLPLKHHDALSDAEACARIVLAAWETGRTANTLVEPPGRGALRAR